jgi:hypothetical protein
MNADDMNEPWVLRLGGFIRRAAQVKQRRDTQLRQRSWNDLKGLQIKGFLIAVGN